MKEKIATFKKLWAIPRYKAIIQLILWISFFFLLYLILVTISIFNKPYEKNNKPVIIKTALENYQEMVNYEYKYTFNYVLNKENNALLIEGTKYNEQNTFKLLGNKYILTNDVIYDINNNEVSNLTDYDLILLEPKNIVLLLDQAKNKEITEYTSGEVKTEYTFDDMLITTYESDNYIKKIDLDITNYMTKNNNKITSYTINITYDNINNIDSFKEV